jgi:HD-GYP domain-containing protein (c-di-GMP phosphodiesterase class II)
MSQRIRLRGIGPSLKERTWESDRHLRIGRLSSMEVKETDPSISRIHAEVVFSDQGWILRDLGSTNGTYLNGLRVGPTGQRLHRCDLLQCGNLVLFVENLIGHGGSVLEKPRFQVDASARQSWEEAVDYLALDVTHRTRPGEHLMTLLRAGHHFSHLASPEDWFRICLQDVALALDAQRGAIVLVEANSDEPSIQAVFSTKPPKTKDAYFSRTVVHRCLARGESLLCSNVKNDAELLESPSVANGAMSSIICALLRSPRRCLGVLHLSRAFSQEPFSADDLRLADAIAVNLSEAVESGRRVQEKRDELFLQTVIALAQAIEMRDEYTGGHTRRVADYSLLLAEELQLSSAERRSLRTGAPIHDIGKIGVDDAVLRKRDKLTAAEFNHLKTHTLKGAAILETIPDLREAVPIARNHHERWDGNGYPDKLAGPQIPRLARIVAVADTFDAMTTDRPYRARMTPTEAFDNIERVSGTQFDPDCAQAFLRLRPRIEKLLQERNTKGDKSVTTAPAISETLEVRRGRTV